MHPISKIRLEAHLAVIRLKETPSGFRVLSTRSVLIENLPSVPKQYIRDSILYNQANEPEKVRCFALFEVDGMEASASSLMNGYIFGIYSDLAAIQDDASTQNGRRSKLIQLLNKEA
jgi:hypothetical protein